MRILLFCLLFVQLLSCKDDAQDIPTPPVVAVDTVVIDSSTIIPSVVIEKKYLLGKFNPQSDDKFSKIPKAYTTKANIYLRNETLEAFTEMATQAQADGIELKIISATRTFNHQKSIWERKWKKYINKHANDSIKAALNILEYSSMPSTSRHHWGTDIDINNLNNSYFTVGKGLKEYQWLQANAAKYGFCQTYTAKDENRPNGYNEEKWHWSYLPLAQQYQQSYKNTVGYSTISGFQGASKAGELKAIDNYVFGINQDCK